MNNIFTRNGLATCISLGFTFSASSAPLPDCGSVKACAQQMIELVNTISEENKSLSKRITELEKERDRHVDLLKNLKEVTSAEAIAKAGLSAMEFVVRHDNSQANLNEATCEIGEKLVGGSCVGGNPNYNPIPPQQRLGDGGQAAVGPLFVSDQGIVQKFTLATKVVCRAYGDVNITAYAVCARSKGVPASKQ